MYRPSPDDFIPGASAQSDEPMKRPDHKAKKHGKPKTKYEYMRRFPKKPRNGEEVGGGHFVFRRGDGQGAFVPACGPLNIPPTIQRWLKPHACTKSTAALTMSSPFAVRSARRRM